MQNIWEKLSNRRPFFVLAPMDDVTDTVFRKIVADVGSPDLSMTEFASSDGFVHAKGRESVERRLRVNDSEKSGGVPVIAQIWGKNPDNYYMMAQDLAKRGCYAGIDINMGCPEKGIVKRGCCGGLIKEENWQLTAEIIKAAKAGAGDLPVSVKTRIGVNEIMTEKWTTYLLEQRLAALTVHGRTVREMSRVPAHWDEIAKVVLIRDQICPQTVIVGNGDVQSMAHGGRLAAETGVDGIMIGRAVLKNIQALTTDPVDMNPHQKIKLFEKHLDLYHQTWGIEKSFEPMKKFAKLYISDFAGAAVLRTRIMSCHSYQEAKAVIAEVTSQKVSA